MNALRSLCGVLALLALAATPATAAAAAVVSVVGRVHLLPEKVEVQAGETLPVDAQIVVPRGAAVQLLVAEQRLSLGACCGARVRLARMIEVEAGSVRAAGTGGELAWGELRVALDPAGGVVLLAEGQVYCLAGRAHVRYRQQHLMISAGSASRVDESGHLAVRRAVPDATLQSRTLEYQAPASWTPPVGELTLNQVRQVHRRVIEQQQHQRELAACGCTESSTPGTGSVNGRTTLTPVERREVHVEVHLRGVPKRAP